MAYPVIKSVFDNFTTAYQNAREARAREERAKEQSMRLFEQNLMAQDQNQRAWNQEGRTADQYTNYLAPLQSTSLSNAQMANELGIAGQAGAVDMARMAGGIKSRVAANQSYADNVYGTQINQNQQSFDASQAYNSLTSQQKDYFNKAGLYQRVAAGSQALDDATYYNSPEAIARRQNTRAFSGMLVDQGIADMQKEADARTQLAANAAKPSSVSQNSYPPTVGRTFGATVVNPPAAVNAPAMPATTTPVRPALQNSPMAAMAASKPVAPQVQKQVASPVDAWIKPEYVTQAALINAARQELRQAAATGNTQAQLSAAKKVQELTNSLDKNFENMQSGLASQIKVRLGV